MAWRHRKPTQPGGPPDGWPSASRVQCSACSPGPGGHWDGMRWRSDLAAHTCARRPDGDGHGPRAVRASPEWIISNRRWSGQVSTAGDTLNRFAIPAAGARRAASAHHIGYTYVRVDAVLSSAVGRTERTGPVRHWVPSEEYMRTSHSVSAARNTARLAFPWTPRFEWGASSRRMSGVRRSATELDVTRPKFGEIWKVTTRNRQSATATCDRHRIPVPAVAVPLSAAVVHHVSQPLVTRCRITASSQTPVRR